MKIKKFLFYKKIDVSLEELTWLHKKLTEALKKNVPLENSGWNKALRNIFQ